MHQRVIGEYFLKIDAGPFIRPVAKIETAANLIAPNKQGPDHYRGQSEGRGHSAGRSGQFGGGSDIGQMLQENLQSLEMTGRHWREALVAASAVDTASAAGFCGSQAALFKSVASS